MSMGITSNILFSKLDEFIAKYYKNQVIKGVILSFLIFILYFISISLLEYFSYFSIFVRSIIFYFSIILLLCTVFYYLLIPFLHLNRIGKIINYKDAARIISKHFPEIQDKLNNTLELIDLSSQDVNSLIVASINQRIALLKPVSFALAINVSANKKYFKILASILVVLLPVFVFYPTIFTEGAVRIIKHNTYYEPKMPFNFQLLNKSLSIEKGSDFTFELQISGDYLPTSAEVNIGTTSYFMQKIAPSKYSFTLKGINNSIDFFFIADEYKSKQFSLSVLPIPQILNFNLVADVPDYTGEKDFLLKNIGDISVPEGSKLHWDISAVDAESIQICLNDSNKLKSIKINDNFEIQSIANKSTKYSILSSNSYIKQKKLLSYTITVIPDLYPTIDVDVKTDSSNMFLNYFTGNIKDDYGFSKMQFVCYKGTRTDSALIIPISIAKANASQEFFYGFDFSKFSNGDNIHYYLEVFDNDGVHGSKSTKSVVYTIKIPTQSEVQKIDAQMTHSLESDMMKSMQMAKDLKKDIETTQKKLLNESTSSWEKSQLMKQLEQKQEQLMQLVNKVKEQNSKKNDLTDMLKNQDQSLLEKQKQIEEMMNKLMDDDFKKMLDEYRNLMDKFNKDKFFDKADDMKLSLEDMEKQLDKNLELLKRMDVEKNIQNAINELKNLKDEQQKLSEKVDDKNSNNDELAKKQDDLNKKMEDLQEKYKESLKKNDNLEKKMDLNSFDKDFNSIKQSMSESSQEMKEGSKSKSKKKMQQSKDNMQNLEQSMAAMMQNNSKKQNEEDETQLRQILDNLLTLSFAQESLQKQTRNVQLSDPKYVTYLNKQLELIDNFSIIKDSLYTLAKRQPTINKTVTDQIKNIERSFIKIKNGFDERNMSQIAVNQQLVMTSENNLALMFAEILKNMQSQSQQQQQSNNPSQCKNPKNKGKGMPSMSDMKSQQQSMKQSLQKMIEQMKQGQGKPGMSQQLSKMMAEQEKYQQMLNDMIKDGGFSPDATQKLNEIKQLIDQNQKDIVNKSISPQTMFRQNQILTRLLEAENAENQRDKDTKRESNQAKQELFSNPNTFLKYKQLSNGNKELLKYDNIKLQSFYKKKYETYLLNINTR